MRGQVRYHCAGVVIVGMAVVGPIVENIAVQGLVCEGHQTLSAFAQISCSPRVELSDKSGDDVRVGGQGAETIGTSMRGERNAWALYLTRRLRVQGTMARRSSMEKGRIEHLVIVEI